MRQPGKHQSALAYWEFLEKDTPAVERSDVSNSAWRKSERKPSRGTGAGSSNDAVPATKGETGHTHKPRQKREYFRFAVRTHPRRKGERIKKKHVEGITSNGTRAGSSADAAPAAQGERDPGRGC